MPLSQFGLEPVQIRQVIKGDAHHADDVLGQLDLVRDDEALDVLGPPQMPKHPRGEESAHPQLSCFEDDEKHRSAVLQQFDHLRPDKSLRGVEQERATGTSFWYDS